MNLEFYVHGMHCPACEILIEDKTSKIKGVKSVKADLNTSKLFIQAENLLNADDLSKSVEKYGYTISTSKEIETKPSKRDILVSFIIASIIFGVFIVSQRLGLINLFNPKQITLPFVFLMGVIASVSTCMMVVGSLVLTLSATFAKNKNYLPLIIFHVSRVVGFFVFGGVIGILGAAFILTPITSFILNLILFVVMTTLALNMLNLFSFSKKLQIKLPKVLSNHVFKLNSQSSYISTALIGASTFFLPCGFTQSMQLYSLTTGNFLQGALVMFVFSLGTLPILSFISFASIKIASKKISTISAFLILIFALFNFISSLQSLLPL